MCLVEINAKQWLYIWDHHVCCFLDSPDPKNAEFVALHKAYDELRGLPAIYHEWKFPIGQQIAVLLKQLEHRLRAAHVGRPNPCSKRSTNTSSRSFVMLILWIGECCPFRKPTKKVYTEFLNKQAAAAIVCKERVDKKQSTHAATYDPVVRAKFGKLGVSLPDDFNECWGPAHCGDHHTSVSGESDDQDWGELPAAFKDRIRSAF